MKAKGEKGSQLVEFALILPLLLLVVFGIIDFGLAIFDKAVITNAAREAARAGIVFAPNRLNQADVENVAVNYCNQNLITFGAVDFDVVADDPTTLSPGDPLQVTVTYRYTLAVSGFVGIGSINLSAQSTMRME